MECFGEALAGIMGERYIAEIDVARALCVSPMLVRRWLTEAASPRLDDVRALARLLCAADARRLEAAAAVSTMGPAAEYEQILARPLCEAERELLERVPRAFRATFATAFTRT